MFTSLFTETFDYFKKSWVSLFSVSFVSLLIMASLLGIFGFVLWQSPATENLVLGLVSGGFIPPEQSVGFIGGFFLVWLAVMAVSMLSQIASFKTLLDIEQNRMQKPFQWFFTDAWAWMWPFFKLALGIFWNFFWRFILVAIVFGVFMGAVLPNVGVPVEMLENPNSVINIIASVVLNIVALWIILPYLLWVPVFFRNEQPAWVSSVKNEVKTLMLGRKTKIFTTLFVFFALLSLLSGGLQMLLLTFVSPEIMMWVLGGFVVFSMLIIAPFSISFLHVFTKRLAESSKKGINTPESEKSL